MDHIQIWHPCLLPISNSGETPNSLGSKIEVLPAPGFLNHDSTMRRYSNLKVCLCPWNKMDNSACLATPHPPPCLKSPCSVI
ncbi:hypothetical protein EK904_001123 [Melospiza melodia maxima]|nr:hypothetical protein EK904_001123 [Melospiza melodia maxima]